MEKMSIILILFLCWFNITAQQVYFNNRYDFLKGPETAWSVLEVDSSYVIVGLLRDSNWTELKLGILKIDYWGNEMLRKYYGQNGFNYFVGFSGSFIKTVDGGYVLGGGVEDSAGNDDFMLYKFDSNLDTMWTKNYGGGGFETGAQCKQTNDEGFVIVGTTSANGSDILLIKTDSTGNLQWQQTYGGVGIEYGFYVDLTLDGGFILGGFTESFGAGESDTYIIKTDSAGNQQWDKTFGGVYRDGIAGIRQTSDTGYIIGTAIGKFKLGPNLFSQVRIIKLNNNGDIVWDKLYGPERETAGVGPPIELNNGDFIATGQTTDIDGWPEGIILKVNSQGNSLWYREYEIFLGPTSQNYLRDIKPTSDGGFIAAGFAMPSDPIDTGTQDMWVMKLDSCGCVFAGCDSACAELVGIEEFQVQSLKFQVFPNPFSGSATILINSPPKASGQAITNHKIKLTIFDITGRKIKTYQIPGYQTHITIHSEEIGTGMFFVQLITDKEILATEKIVIINR